MKDRYKVGDRRAFLLEVDEGPPAYVFGKTALFNTPRNATAPADEPWHYIELGVVHSGELKVLEVVQIGEGGEKTINDERRGITRILWKVVDEVGDPPSTTSSD
jgi:hypothetical protein